jgi:hypothetical protein
VPDPEPWIRLSRRGQDPMEPEALYEGIPSHLSRQLWEWYSRWIDDEIRDEIQLRFRLKVTWHDEQTFEQAFDELVTEDPELYLDVVDLTLWICARRVGPPLLPGETQFVDKDSVDSAWAPEQLQGLLKRAGSAWRVASDGRSLQRRVPEATLEAFEAAAQPGTEAARHLAAAWQATYGRDPSASVAYREAIRAVEAVVIPAVEPKNTKATLGTVLRTLRDQAASWELAILGLDRKPRDIFPLLSMLELLWQGQSDRHAPITPVPLDAAMMAVHLATTLVQWFDSGSVRQRRTQVLVVGRDGSI